LLFGFVVQLPALEATCPHKAVIFGSTPPPWLQSTGSMIEFVKPAVVVIAAAVTPK
jgi:hypothetical protein